MYTEYESNNSGGDWWLSDDDWRALEAAGWVVDWRNKSMSPLVENGRWLGALATSARRDGLSLRDAVEEREQITGKLSTDAGCPCCGPPHSFTEYDDEGRYVASGPETSYIASW